MECLLLFRNLAQGAFIHRPPALSPEERPARLPTWSSVMAQVTLDLHFRLVGELPAGDTREADMGSNP